MRLVPPIWFVFAALCAGALRGQGDPHPARGLKLETIEWLDDGAEFLDKRRFKTRLTQQETAVDREKLLDTALQRARKTGQPVLWYVYKIVENRKRGRQMIRAPVLDIYMRQLIFCDPDVSRIVKNSFTPLRTVFDEALCKRFDLRPLTFLEPAVLFLSPEGKVLHVVRTVRTFDATWFATVLRDVLRKAKGTLQTDDVDKALDRGEWNVALSILERNPGKTADDFYRRAVMHRRLRRGDDALQSLESASARLAEQAKAMPPSRGRRRGRSRRRRLPPALREMSNQIAAEKGAVLVAMGRFKEAVPPLREAADATSGRRRTEARYRLGLLRLAVGDEAGAMRRFQKLVQDDGEDPFARRARVNLMVGVDDGLSLGAALFSYERLTWLPPAAYTRLPGDTRWPGEPLADTELAARGVRAILSHQRADGGWKNSRYAYCPDARITPNVWVAITALCCQALLRHREGFPDKKRIDAALRRGERYLMDPNALNRGRNEDVYSDAYRLLYFGRRWQVDVSRRAELQEHMRHIVDAAGFRQKSQGFWAHEYSNAFCTAAMVQGLLAAKNAGVTVPDKMLEGARRSLLSARATDGSFSYGGAARGKPRKGSLKNASTRMPMCEGALHALGASDEERMVFAFDNFWEHYAAIEGVRHTDFHSDGQIAGFMFFHSLYHTSLAIDQLPENRAQIERQRLRDKVRGYAEIDGTFLDSEELGRSYGTAMALLILANTLE